VSVPTIEDRVTNLEHEVQYLKAFAGPGQNDALSANVAEIRVIVTDLKKQVDRLEKRIDARLDGIGTRLERVDASLDGVDTRLERVDTQLESHTGLLAEILSRLPKPATPMDN
jgi:archaellum component FlaC